MTRHGLQINASIIVSELNEIGFGKLFGGVGGAVSLALQKKSDKEFL